MRYRRSTYADDVFDDFLFEKNLQGDIIAVYNSSGTKIVSYTYDAYGRVTQTVTSGYSSSPAKYNPFRYRGYYYDENTGFYYLNSRYYDPITARFINADGYISTGQGLIGCNMFAYCNNNPIMNVDPMGQFSWAKLGMAVLTVALVTTATALAVATAGTAMGASAALVATAVKLTIAGGVIAGTTEIVDQICTEGDVTDLEAVETSTFIGSVEAPMEYFTGGISGFTSCVIDAGFSILTSTYEDVRNGQDFWSSANENAQEHLLVSGIEWGMQKLIPFKVSLGDVMDVLEKTLA